MRFSLALVVASLVHAGTAGAEPWPDPARDIEEGGYGYAFDDDPLYALGEDALGVLVRVKPESVRVLLIRPRTSFVSEMFQSAEDF